VVTKARASAIMIDQIQHMLNRMRPSVSGKSGALSSRFRTSDVLQEAAVQLLQEAEKRPNGGDVSLAWLRCIGHGTVTKLRTKHLAAKRSKSSESPLTDFDTHSNSQDSPAEKASFRELSGNLVVCLAALNRDQREIIERYLADQESFSSIARKMDRPPHWVRRTYLKAISELKSMMVDRTEAE